jgi:hypothetical protein
MNEDYCNVYVLQRSRLLLGIVNAELDVRHAEMNKTPTIVCVDKQHPHENIEFKLIAPSLCFVRSLLTSLENNLQYRFCRGGICHGNVTEFLESAKYVSVPFINLAKIYEILKHYCVQKGTATTWLLHRDDF